MSQYIPFFLVYYFVLFSQLRGLFCHPLPSSREGSESSAGPPTIFDSRVLHTVKFLFTRSLILGKTAARDETGRKKSIIETGDTERALHVKVDPRQFGQTLLDQANQNAARKSDIYMNKAIDATALGVAVLKLIFGKDAKMIMKDAKDRDAQASLRTKEFRPDTTPWSIPGSEETTTAERKSFSTDRTSNPQKSDKIAQLSVNILKLVKNLQPTSSFVDKSTDGKKFTKNKPVVHMKSETIHEGYTDSEKNLARLLSLIKDTKSSAKEEKGNKKSWVLLKVPAKQPQDEIGMLSDPAKTEESSSDDSSNHENKFDQGRKQLHSQELHLKAPKKQQSSERESITSSIQTISKTLKSEPVQEVNPVKTDVTPKTGYEDSVKNLLKALESTTDKQSQSHETKHIVQHKTYSPSHHKLELVSAKKAEENAAAKDTLSSNTGGAVVSLDALRQLGQLLGLSAPRSERISPYTGTVDTLTPATPMPLQALQDLVATKPTPTPKPTAPPTIPAKYSVSREMSLNRISEQLKMFAERGLRGHNEYRKLHHAEPLKWSEDLASAAEKLAYQAAKQGATTRSNFVESKGYGENVAKISNVALENAGEEATRHWYNEKEHFTFSDPGINDETTAFTQVIWKNTKTLGMGAAKDDDTGELYVVALYYPKGNDEGTLRENVQSDSKDNTDVYASIFKKSMPVHYDET